MAKILVLRFSSIGDVLQCLSVAGALEKRFPGAEIHWVTRNDLKSLIEDHPAISQVFSIHKGEGFKELWQLASELRHQKYDYIYDAHNNLRSHLICWFMYGPWLLFGRLRGLHFLRRSIPRWKRFVLFRFRRNYFRQPFSGQRDLLEPLKVWNIEETAPPPPQLFFKPMDEETALRLKSQGEYIALAPSAAYPLKRWPLEHWKELIRLLPDARFVVLGGPGDTFLEELVQVAPERVVNTAGSLSLTESSAVVKNSRLLVANDTGVLHMGEQLGVSSIALMGPAPFGFPSRPLTKIMELDLYCRPCSKHGQGPCVNAKFHKCLVDISPQMVLSEVQKILRS